MFLSRGKGSFCELGSLGAMAWSHGSVLAGIFAASCVCVLLLLPQQGHPDDLMQVKGKVTMPISGQAKILWGDNEDHILPEAFKMQVTLRDGENYRCICGSISFAPEFRVTE
jgi:hypothetical protein